MGRHYDGKVSIKIYLLGVNWGKLGFGENNTCVVGGVGVVCV